MATEFISFFKTVLIFALSISLLATHTDKDRIKHSIARTIFEIFMRGVYVIVGLFALLFFAFTGGYMSAALQMIWARGAEMFYRGAGL